MNLKGKTTLITGASAGIGEACARVFAEAGSDLIITARRFERIQKLSEELTAKHNIKCLPIEMDVRNRVLVNESIENLPAEFSKIDILINNAGKSLGLDPLQDGDYNDWDEMIDTNIKGLLYVTKAVAPKMIEKGEGFVINISSIAGKHAYPKGNVYCASKAAARTLSESMVIDFNGTGVRVCNIDPGLVETEFSLVRFHGDSERAENVYKNFTPLTGYDIADIALFTVTRPPHVMIQDVTVTPTAQASAYIIHKK